MGRGFRREADEFVADLSDEERLVLVALLEQTAMILTSAQLRTRDDVAREDADERVGEGAGENAGEGAGGDEFDRIMRSSGLAESTFATAADRDDTAGIDAGFAEWGAGADRALSRLLPDGHHDDPLSAAEFRRFSARGVRDVKLARIKAAIAAVTPDGRGLRVDEPTAVAVLVSLTDVRLVLADRLGLSTEEDARRLDEQVESEQFDDVSGLVLAYDYLTWLQETLAEALSE